MLKVCPYKCKESSDLNFRGKLKAIHSAYLIINIVWYFQKKCDIDINTIFWKWSDNCLTIYRQTISRGLIWEPKQFPPFSAQLFTQPTHLTAHPIVQFWDEVASLGFRDQPDYSKFASSFHWGAEQSGFNTAWEAEVQWQDLEGDVKKESSG